MYQKILILGSTGMLGSQLLKFYESFPDVVVKGVSRSGLNGDKVDLLKKNDLVKYFERFKPQVIFNCAANTNINDCEEKPIEAYEINAYMPGYVSDYCKKNSIKYVHFSTDHYYVGAKKRHHTNEEVNLVNEYSKTKYLGEILVKQNYESLIIRTNIVGYKYYSHRSTFAEWVINELKDQHYIDGYRNVYVSSIDIYSLSSVIHKMVKENAVGIYNVASRDVYSKLEFIYELCSVFGYDKKYVNEVDYISSGTFKRATSMGLDVGKVEKEYEIKLPTLSEVIINLFNQNKRLSNV
jgi:dTDP-4-dehydrorhamnose reductase